MIVQDNRAIRTRYFSGCRRSHASALLEVAILLRFKNCASLLDRAGQCCFLCLQGKKTGQYAIQVPCMRPTKQRRVISYKLSKEVSDSKLKRVPGGETYEELNPMENACESDAAIYQRLKETCFQYQGNWKRWLPFYGITDVREVNVRLKVIIYLIFTDCENYSSNLSES
jgi:hypothetical protein